jgi:hypothetical protein
MCAAIRSILPEIFSDERKRRRYDGKNKIRGWFRLDRYRLSLHRSQILRDS